MKGKYRISYVVFCNWNNEWISLVYVKAPLHWVIFVAICLPIQSWRRCDKVARKHSLKLMNTRHTHEKVFKNLLLPVRPDRVLAF